MLFFVVFRTFSNACVCDVVCCVFSSPPSSEIKRAQRASIAQLWRQTSPFPSTARTRSCRARWTTCRWQSTTAIATSSRSYCKVRQAYLTYKMCIYLSIDNLICCCCCCCCTFRIIFQLRPEHIVQLLDGRQVRLVSQPVHGVAAQLGDLATVDAVRHRSVRLRSRCRPHKRTSISHAQSRSKILLLIKCIYTY